MTLHGAELESSFIEDKDVEHCYEVPHATGEIFLYEVVPPRRIGKMAAERLRRTCLLHRMHSATMPWNIHAA